MRELTQMEMSVVGGGYEGDFATETVTVNARKEVQWSNFSDFRYDYSVANNSPEGRDGGGGGGLTEQVKSETGTALTMSGLFLGFAGAAAAVVSTGAGLVLAAAGAVSAGVGYLVDKGQIQQP